MEVFKDLAMGLMLICFGVAVFVVAIRFCLDSAQCMNLRELELRHQRDLLAANERANATNAANAEREFASREAERDLRERELAESKRENDMRRDQLDRGY